NSEGGWAPLPVIIKADEKDPRSIYQEAVIHVALLLRGRQSFCRQQRIKKIKNYNKATEPGREILKGYEFSKEIEKLIKDMKKKLGEEIEAENKEAQIKQEISYKLHKYCLDQADKAHFEKNYA